ncbi:MAG: class I SAM-dependent methyltransferase [Bacteroidota bacterium]|jgi:SAM-dependent methyltransferase
MFFADRITKIKSDYKVLEIGPGSHPHHRSDVFLELNYNSEEDKIAQFGHSEELVTNKKIIFYDGTKFPISDNEFDYVICSHVLEHVPDVNLFLSEIFRVSKYGGYFEYPLITYDYLYNFNVHLNFLKFDGKSLFVMKKTATPLDFFKPIHTFFNHTLNNGYSDILTKLPDNFFQGFEWEEPFKVIESNDIKDFLVYQIDKSADNSNQHTVSYTLKLLLFLIKNKIISAFKNKTQK